MTPRERQIAAVRSFNRFYTRLLGLLDETLLDSPVSLAEARVLWEIRESPGCRAEDLIAGLGLDRGYLSRILRRLERRGMVSRTRDGRDGRMRPLHLTRAGEQFMDSLDSQASGQVGGLIERLPRAARERLVRAMAEIQALLPGASARRPAAEVRPDARLPGRPGGRIMGRGKGRHAHP